MVIEAWPALSPPIRAAVLALVAASVQVAPTAPAPAPVLVAASAG